MKTWAPLHGYPVNDVTRRHVADQLERIRTARGPTAAKNARVYLSGCYSWAMKSGFADHNPVIGSPAPTAPPSKARTLKEHELVAIWNACKHLGEYGRIVRLMVLLGQRRDEIAGMAWSEIDVDRKLWTLPAARTKNGREHEVPLPDSALALLPERRLGRDLVFGRQGPFSGFSRAKARLDGRTGLSESWRLHDLRHSFVTHANEIGIEPHIIEAAVNHVSGSRGGIAGRYNAAKYREPKRRALQRYAHWIEGLVSGCQAVNVLAFG